MAERHPPQNRSKPRRRPQIFQTLEIHPRNQRLHTRRGPLPGPDEMSLAQAEVFPEEVGVGLLLLGPTLRGVFLAQERGKGVVLGQVMVLGGARSEDTRNEQSPFAVKPIRPNTPELHDATQ
jgi:hypothetical protein